MHLDGDTLGRFLEHASVAVAAGLGAYLRARHVKKAALATAGAACALALALAPRLDAMETFLREHFKFPRPGA